MCCLGEIQTFFHGKTMVAEDEAGNLMPVGADEVAAQGWQEVTGWKRGVYARNGIVEPDVGVNWQEGNTHQDRKQDPNDGAYYF